MHRTGILDDPIVGLRGVEILLECVVLFALHEGIVRTIQDEDLRLDGSRCRCWGIETKRGVKTGNGAQVGTSARHVQHDRATEAVTNGTDALGINRDLLGELVPRGVKA